MLCCVLCVCVCVCVCVRSCVCLCACVCLCNMCVARQHLYLHPVPFAVPEMIHGFVCRGDVAKPAIARDAQAALELAVAYFDRLMPRPVRFVVLHGLNMDKRGRIDVDKFGTTTLAQYNEFIHAWTAKVCLPGCCPPLCVNDVRVCACVLCVCARVCVVVVVAAAAAVVVVVVYPCFVMCACACTCFSVCLLVCVGA